MGDWVIIVLAGIGGVVAALGACTAVVRAWAWLRLHVLRRSPIKGFLIDLTRGADRMRAAGWKLRLRGLVVGRVGFGIVVGTPPTRTCEECGDRFPNEAACIAHENRVHPEARP